MEIWKQLKESLIYTYEISNKGRVRSKPKEVLYKNNKVVKYKGKVLSPQDNTNGYLKICLYKSKGKTKSFYIHRLVAKYFVKGYKLGLEVNHIDGNTYNNNSDNLEWCNSKENSIKSSSTKLSFRQVQCIFEMRHELNVSVKELAKINKVSERHIRRILNYKSREDG